VADTIGAIAPRASILRRRTRGTEIAVERFRRRFDMGTAAATEAISESQHAGRTTAATASSTATWRRADAHGVSYVGWTFNAWDCATGPALVTDLAGTPTTFGQGFRDHGLTLRR
jgi:hypothetical protein